MKTSPYSIPITILLLIFFTNTISSQPPIAWENTIGGSNIDRLDASLILPDSSIIIAGRSNSNISGDKSENSKGNYDYWVTKLDPSGNVLWDKTIGGSRRDILYDLELLTDGSILLGGESRSNISGDKSQNSKGGDDFWIVKLDSSGNKLWDKTYGGSDDEEFVEMAQLSDGSIILVGSSDSDISGDKTENSIGNYDFWVLRIDSIGNVIWDNTIGGTGSDLTRKMIVLPDDEILIAGPSNSNTSGDKSQNSNGGFDYWLVKIDSSGAKLWDKTYGGNDKDDCRTITALANGELILGGESLSDISGDKSEDSKGGDDYWVLKLDTAGNKIVDKTIGGSNTEYLCDVQIFSTGDILLGGWSDSNISGDKTENSKGDFDYWLVNIDTSLD